jgi:predicted outer membrane repeat protein
LFVRNKNTSYSYLSGSAISSEGYVSLSIIDFSIYIFKKYRKI